MGDVSDRRDSSEKGERTQYTETRERGRDPGEKSKVRSRPGPVATMRLYSQSPSPPPELNQWKQKDGRNEERRTEERKTEERRNEERSEPVEIKIEEEHVVNAKPNNEKQVKNKSDDSTNEENEGDDDVMKK